MGIRVLLADDHQIVRTGLRTILGKLRDVEIVGEAEDGRTAVELSRELKPDVVIMDIAMPKLNGLEASRQIVSMGLSTRVMVLSMHSDRQYVVEMLKAGASGYLLKSCAAAELGLALKAMVDKRVYLSPKVADVLVDHFVRQTGPPQPQQVRTSLTAREREVLQLLAEGKTSKEMAKALQISVKTVDTHRQEIMARLNLRTVAELTKYAVREGLTPLEC